MPTKRAAGLVGAMHRRELIRFSRRFESSKIRGYVLDVGPQFFLLALVSDRIRSEEHTSELQSHLNLVCRLLLEKKNKRLISKRHYIPPTVVGLTNRPHGWRCTTSHAQWIQQRRDQPHAPLMKPTTHPHETRVPL